MKITSIAACAVLGTTIFISLPSFARKINDISFNYDANNGFQAKVNFEKGNPGDDHVLYVVWDFVDHGANLHDWPNATTVRVDPIDPEATEAVVSLPSGARRMNAFRAFFAQPERTGKYDKLISSIRSAGSAYIDTGHLCTPKCEVFLDFGVLGYAGDGSNNTYKNKNFLGTYSDVGHLSMRAFVYQYGNCYIGCGSGNDTVLAPICPPGGKTIKPSSGRTKITLTPAIRSVHFVKDTTDFHLPFSFNGATEISQYTLTLFGAKGSTGVSGILPAGVIYSASIKEGLNYVRKMYPAVKDGVAGLWDAVDDKFYPSSGANAFLPTDTQDVSYEEVSFNKQVNDVIIPRDNQISVSHCEMISTRRVTGLSFIPREDGTVRGQVALSAGASGDVDVLYMAWGEIDYGENMEDWPNLKRIGALRPNETSKSFIFDGGLDPQQYYRPFLATAWRPTVSKVLEYICSTGEAYVDTGYSVTPNTEIELDFQTSETSGIFYGVYSTGTEYGVVTRRNNKQVLFYYNLNQAVEWAGNIEANLSSTRITVTTKGVQIKVSTVAKTTTISKPNLGIDQATMPLYVFAASKKDANGEIVSTTALGSGCLYGATFFEDGAYKRRFYPCVNEEGTAGLWDQVENKFYPSKGSKDFLATDSEGNDIPEAAFPVETVYTSSSAVNGKCSTGFSVRVR